MSRTYGHRCERCRFMNVPVDSKGRRVIHPNMLYDCTVPPPSMPDCFELLQVVHGKMRYGGPTPIRRKVSPHEGKSCAGFQRLPSPTKETIACVSSSPQLSASD